MSPIPIAGKGCCIEIMTGAALHHSADTVIRYEDIEINDKTVTLMDVVVKRGQNVHLRGKDRKEGEVIVDSNRVITPPVMGLAASIGKLELLVKRLPRVIIRSEEHTSELQSLMRISYAVFCLKQKKTT